MPKIYQCNACGGDTTNEPEFLRDENQWEPPFCDECELRAIELINKVMDDTPKEQVDG